MASFKDLFKSADWKQEKHVPVIESPDEVKKGDVCRITVSVGKRILILQNIISGGLMFIFWRKARIFLWKSGNLNLMRTANLLRALI
jgi:hypothetical protein